MLLPCSMLDALLGRYLGTLGITQEHMALGYSIYGIAQLVGSIALLLQSWRAAASIRLPTQYTLILVTVVTALGSTLLMVLAPASYQLLLVARALQGTMGAVYTIYAMTLLVQWFPPAWQMQAVAFMTAGEQVACHPAVAHSSLPILHDCLRFSCSNMRLAGIVLHRLSLQVALAVHSLHRQRLTPLHTCACLIFSLQAKPVVTA